MSKKKKMKDDDLKKVSGGTELAEDQAGSPSDETYARRLAIAKKVRMQGLPDAELGDIAGGTEVAENPPEGGSDDTYARRLAIAKKVRLQGTPDAELE